MNTLQPRQWAWIRRPDYSKGQIQSLILCPACAKKCSTKLEPLWENCVDPGTTREKIYAKCCVCSGERMNQPNFHCTIISDRVEIYRFNRMIGTVVQIGTNEPVITLFAETSGTQELTFNELAIIQDNWNQCEEMINKRLTERGIVVK